MFIILDPDWSFECISSITVSWLVTFNSIKTLTGRNYFKLGYGFKATAGIKDWNWFLQSTRPLGDLFCRPAQCEQDCFIFYQQRNRCVLTLFYLFFLFLGWMNDIKEYLKITYIMTESLYMIVWQKIGQKYIS